MSTLSTPQCVMTSPLWRVFIYFWTWTTAVDLAHDFIIGRREVLAVASRMASVIIFDLPGYISLAKCAICCHLRGFLNTTTYRQLILHVLWPFAWSNRFYTIYIQDVFIWRQILVKNSQSSYYQNPSNRRWSWDEIGMAPCLRRRWDLSQKEHIVSTTCIRAAIDRNTKSHIIWVYLHRGVY